MIIVLANNFISTWQNSIFFLKFLIKLRIIYNLSSPVINCIWMSYLIMCVFVIYEQICKVLNNVFECMHLYSVFEMKNIITIMNFIYHNNYNHHNHHHNYQYYHCYYYWYLYCSECLIDVHLTLVINTLSNTCIIYYNRYLWVM